MKKILIFTTMALVMVASAFGFSSLKVNADSDLDESLFNNAEIYSWSVSNVADVSSIVSYYQYYYYDAQNWSNKTNANIVSNNVVLNGMNYYYHTQQIPYYYSLLIPNFNITTGFTLVCNTVNSYISLTVGVLYSDNTFEQFTTNGFITYFPVESKEIKAIGYLNDTEHLYSTSIYTSENEKLNSNLYYQGYSEGYQSGYSQGIQEQESYYNSIIAGKDSTIADLQSQLASDDRIGFSFFELLNNIVKFPVKAIHSIFYQDELLVDNNGDPILDSNGDFQYVTSDQPIELFGVSIIGVVVGVISIGLCITIIVIVKKVWK